jgi:hypothetical protein
MTRRIEVPEEAYVEDGGPPLLTAGCLDQTHCYLPIDEMLGREAMK